MSVTLILQSVIFSQAHGNVEKEETNKNTKMRGRVNTVEKDCEQLCDQAGTSKMNYSVRNANGPA